MMGLKIKQMDVFTLKRFAVNPLAVCVLPKVADSVYGSPLEPSRCAPIWWFLFSHFEMGDAYGGTYAIA